jgi:predicted enzyme related to lactoylglutathione lyase
LALATAMKDCVPGAQGGAVALESDDFEGMVAHLQSAGLTFVKESADTGVCRFPRFHDPDGNHLVLHRIHG